jgi:hypothetical protein
MALGDKIHLRKLLGGRGRAKNYYNGFRCISLMKHLPRMCKTLSSISNTKKKKKGGVHTYNSSTREAEAGKSQVQG